jgi:hypothetical protein
MFRATLGAALLLCCSGLGCGEREVIYQDREVFFDYDPDEAQASMEKTIQVGVYEEQLFRSIEAQDELHIVAGFQGGIWAHISLRVTGLRSRGRIEARLSLGEDGSGAVVGETGFPIKLVRTAEGFLEAYDIPIPVGDRGSAMADVAQYFGRPALLTVRYSTPDFEPLEAQLIVILERG